MTPAIQQLKRHKISYQLHQYQHDANAAAYGLEVVEKLQLNAEQVFKTLVVCTDCQQLAVALVPVNKQLNLKRIAKTLSVKKVKMAEVKQVENSTGYILGGVSPLGQKKSLRTIIDDSAQDFDLVYISGGKRGLEVALCPNDLATLSRANFSAITNSANEEE